MTFQLDQFDVMEHLWATLEKTADGEHIRYTEYDLEQLWQMGFVDTGRVSMQQWKRAFEHVLQADGSFLLTKGDFLALNAYRYQGEIRIPFDAMQINEGKYTDEGFDELIDASVRPSTNLSPDDLRTFVRKLKADFRQPDDLILVKQPAKQRIKELLGRHPSPLRNLELLMDQMIAAQGDEMEGQIAKAEADAATMQAAIQVSSFSAAPTSRVEEKALGLKALQKTRQQPAPASSLEGKPTTALKKIRRSRKGMRG